MTSLDPGNLPLGQPENGAVTTSRGSPNTDQNNNKHLSKEHKDDAIGPVFAGGINCKALDDSVPKYSGQSSGNPKDWLQKFNRLTRLKGWSKNTACAVLPLYLDGSAQQWHSGLSASIQEDMEILQEQFVQSFGLSKGQVLSKLDNLAYRKQQPGESVDQLLTYIAAQCRQLDRTDDQEMEYVIRGLRQDIKTHVLLHEPGTLAEVKRLSLLAETVLASTVQAPQPVNALVKQQHTRSARLGKCTKCGRHHAPDQCPAQGKKCMKCGKANHFKVMCRSKVTANKFVKDNSNKRD